MVRVSIIAGSKSDQPIVDEASKVLDKFKIEYEIKILSAHRNHAQLENYVKNSKAEIFIGIAGLSAALPGFIASLTDKPVIGVPVNVKLEGLDALLSMMQMPSGVPVATVSIDGGKNAAILAMKILALKDKKLAEKLRLL